MTSVVYDGAVGYTWTFSGPVTLTSQDPTNFTVSGGPGNPVTGVQISANSWKKTYGGGGGVGSAWAATSPFSNVVEAASIASPQSGLVT